MPFNLTQKILSAHLTDGQAVSGREVGIRIDQSLTQDATGTTAFLLLEAMDIPRVRTELSVSYVDHNMPQFGPENHNDHIYLQSVAARMGVYFSRPGNGICHQVHLERFARPGRTLLGSDSHTPTCGGMGMIAIGAGGLDVAVAMGGGAFYLAWPKVIGVELRGKLPPWVSAKDIILRVLSILTTKGNVGCVIEYFGPGVAGLSVPARATCTNMGAELGVTTSIFPADEVTRQFLAAQGRETQFTPLSADEGAAYDRLTKRLHKEKDKAVIDNINRFCTQVEIGKPDKDGFVEVSFGRIVLDLAELEPLAAAPSSPDNVVRVADIAGLKVNQVAIGSCTNSSVQDMSLCAAALHGRMVHPDVELAISPGSRQVLSMLAESGRLADMVAAGARILECACGPCIGQGFSPADGAVSLRTFNRNFAGRSGTEGDKIYLVSPETAIAAAIFGQVTDPRDLSNLLGFESAKIAPPGRFRVDDRMLIPPLPDSTGVEVIRGPTIVKPPAGQPPPDRLDGRVLIKVADKITTDHIMPAGTLLKYRSNVPQYADYVFNCFNEAGKPTFAQRALALKDAGRAGIVVAGDSYGQGSSREHAALCPMCLGVRAVIAKAIERMHQANLVNFAVLPLIFADPADYDRIQAGDDLLIADLRLAVESQEDATVKNATRNFEFPCKILLAPRQRKILSAGGLLAYTRKGP
ncbi:MAG: aconitate hydratase [Planctomycetes bacterium]|nr:aconitate hydratase [Planctomycetota bacterium]